MTDHNSCLNYIKLLLSMSCADFSENLKIHNIFCETVVSNFDLINKYLLCPKLLFWTVYKMKYYFHLQTTSRLFNFQLLRECSEKLNGNCYALKIKWSRCALIITRILLMHEAWNKPTNPVMGKIYCICI